MKTNYNFNTPWESDYWMESNGFFCGLNMVEALKTKQNNGDAISHVLPPYNWRSSFLVDEYPSCPSNWMKSSGRLSSYFVPVQENQGIWLDFNKNNNHNYHVSIVVSIQGINAITGLPCKDPCLEQYIDECPVHKVPFGHNRLCEQCGFKWPKQNYISTTSTSIDHLWIDGFRAANGVVQQYILTEQTMKGVASNIIGSDRVYAIGISFFLSKNPKPINSEMYGSRRAGFFGDKFNRACENINGTYSTHTTDLTDAINQLSNTTNDPNITITTNHSFDISSLCDCDRHIDKNGSCNDENDCLELAVFAASIDPNAYCQSYVENNSKVNHTFRDKKSNANPIQNVKKMEIGAGASIDQKIGDDPEPLDFWRDKPEALLCINYCSEDDCKSILNNGKVSKQGDPKGFLKDIPHGN